jgi:hypothetical protein
MQYTEEFLQFAESLKLVRKADIEKDNENIIDLVYTDLLPNNGILSKVNLPRTSILMGRKGTGKSTIIQKSMKDMSFNKNVIGIYIDVKTLYDGATPQILIDNAADEFSNISKEITKYLIYKNFLKEVIEKTKDTFRNILKNHNIIKRFTSFMNFDCEEVDSTLDEIQSSLDDVFKNIDLSLYRSIKNSVESSSGSQSSLQLGLSVNPTLTAGFSANNEEIFKSEFDSTMLRYLDIKKCLIDNFIKIRNTIDVKYLYIYLDDYSEIDEKAQELFMDWFISPLNNLSDDFIKFKIATYPNRFYTGKLDNQKFDEINLDFYSALYSYKNITKMEDIAIDYTKRVIENRFKVYLPKTHISDFFDINDDELYELLFDVSVNTPRKIGYILSFCYETHLSYNKKITKAAISAASLRYFEEITQKYFESNRYVLRTFEDMVTIENQKELIKKIINKEIDNKLNINKSSAKKFKIPNPPTSHFLVSNTLSNLLDTLELNGYISTYNKINDKYNIPSTLYALDYGLCQKYNLNFGRPKDTNLRKYYSDPKFILNTLIKDHFNSNQTILCEKGHEYPFEMLSEIDRFGMLCPKCVQERIFTTCRVEVSNKEILQKIKDYEQSVIRLNDEIEFGILDFLYRNQNASYSSFEIAQELDCYWQLINKRASKLLEKMLIRLDLSKTDQDKRRYYLICDSSRQLLSEYANK